VQDPDQPSERLVEQRMRNRAMESLIAPSEGDAGVRSVGAGEYVNQFFDVIDDDIPWHWREWSCFTPESRASMRCIGCSRRRGAATPQILSDDDFIESGWPAMLQPAARLALNIMSGRERFREDVEEMSPSE
jgi:hypothetical protein